MLESIGLLLGVLGILFAFESPRRGLLRLVGIKPSPANEHHDRKTIDQLVAIQKAQLDLELEKQEREYMPHFTSGGSSSRDGWLSLHISNEGQSVTGITFPGKLIVGNANSISIYPINIESRKDARLTLTGSIVLPIRFRVEFYDPAGRRRDQIYEISQEHKLSRVAMQ
jgi:hypothetical protein